MGNDKQLEEKLKNKLKEIFRFESEDLDFGIYRIMNIKRREIEEVIEREVEEKIKEIVEKVIEEKVEEMIAEIGEETLDYYLSQKALLGLPELVSEIEKRINYLEVKIKEFSAKLEKERVEIKNASGEELVEEKKEEGIIKKTEEKREEDLTENEKEMLCNALTEIGYHVNKEDIEKLFMKKDGFIKPIFYMGSDFPIFNREMKKRGYKYFSKRGWRKAEVGRGISIGLYSSYPSYCIPLWIYPP